VTEFTQSRPRRVSGVPTLLKGVIATCVSIGLFYDEAQGLSEQGSAEQMRVIWRQAVKTGPLPLGCMGTPAVGQNGTIYVPASNFLSALNPDGSEKWSRGEKRGLTSIGDVTIDDQGTIYAGSDGLNAFNPDGSLKWTIPNLGGAPENHSVAIGQNNTIYFMRGGKLCAATTEGLIIWEEHGTEMIPQSFAPVIDSAGVIYCQAGPRRSGIRALASDRSLKEVFRRDEETLFSPFQPGIDQFGNLYFGGRKNLYAVDSRGGLRWIFKTDDYVPNSPAIAPDGTIYFGCADGYLYAVNSSGELRWKFRTDGRVASAPAIDSQGNIYFTSWDKNFYCLDSNGSLKSVVRVTAGYGNPIIAADGTIYLVDVGCVYAIAGLAPPSPGPWPMKRHDAQGTGRVRSLEANAKRTDIQQ
jgi:outer membrane protein assembly factor BamB